MKSNGDEATDFHDKEFPKVGSNHTWLAVINVDSVLKKHGSYYLKVFLKEINFENVFLKGAILEKKFENILFQRAILKTSFLRNSQKLLSLVLIGMAGNCDGCCLRWLLIQPNLGFSFDSSELMGFQF